MMQFHLHQLLLYMMMQVLRLNQYPQEVRRLRHADGVPHARAEDRVEVDGVPVGVRADLRYYLLNKPVGVVTTASDPQGRPTVVQIVPAEPRVYPVGRLDVATEGLLILTNDGELTNHLAHPRHGVEKEYLAEVQGRLDGGDLRRLREGVELEDGMTAPAKVSQPEPGILRITIHEGRNRQVRRMVEALGARVLPESRAREIVKTFLQTAFEGGRHAGRVAKIHAIEPSSDSSRA